MIFARRWDEHLCVRTHCIRNTVNLITIWATVYLHQKHFKCFFSEWFGCDGSQFSFLIDKSIIGLVKGCLRPKKNSHSQLCLQLYMRHGFFFLSFLFITSHTDNNRGFEKDFKFVEEILSRQSTVTASVDWMWIKPYILSRPFFFCANCLHPSQNVSTSESLIGLLVCLGDLICIECSFYWIVLISHRLKAHSCKKLATKRWNWMFANVEHIIINALEAWDITPSNGKACRR